MSVSFTFPIAENRVVRGNFFPAVHTPQATLIICHGFKGFKDWGFFPYAAEALAKDVQVLTFNFSHNGVGESLTEFDELEKFAIDTPTLDMEDLDLLIHNMGTDALPLPSFVAGLPLYLLGHSRGAAISLLYALEYPERIQGVIGWNGATHPNIFTVEQVEQFKEQGRSYVQNSRTKQQMPLDLAIYEDLERNKEKYDIHQRIKQSPFSVILIQGTNDFPRLLHSTERIVQANPAIQWVKIEDGDHVFNCKHPFEGETAPLKNALDQTAQFLLEDLQRRA